MIDFSEFKNITKEEWLEKVRADLKGKALESLDFEVEDGLVLTPFFHREDREKYPTEGLSNFREGGWQTGSIFITNTPKTTNLQLKEDLEGGVNAPLIVIDNDFSTADIELLYEGINPMWISNYFDGQDSVVLQDFFEKWVAYLQTKDYDLSGVKGNLGLSPNVATAAKNKGFLEMDMPNFSLFRIREAEASNYSSGLATLLKDANRLFDDLGAELAVRQIQFQMTVDKNYFASIAKLRAFHILWANLLQAYGLPSDLSPDISVHFAPSTVSSDEYQNMISAATLALSAVIGGAATLFIPPASTPETPLTRRMARNVNHILAMESYLDKIVDPAAGSYYIESLTETFAKKAWTKL